MLMLGCERVINVSIKNVAPKVVIEGVLTDDSTCRVRISQTSNFNDTINLRGISNATVTITEEGQQAIRLVESSYAGIYRAAFSGKPGRNYNLRVACDAPVVLTDGSIGYEPKVFTATSKMPQRVVLDSLYVTERVFLGKQRMVATIRYTDPPAFGNAYRFVQYVDGNEESTIFTTKDDLINGRMVVDELLIFNNDYTLRKCDQLRVVLQSIDMPNYLYWYSLSQGALGSSQAASPGNPLSNIVGGALGYFSAHAVSAKNIAVFPDSTCSYPAKK